MPVFLSTGFRPFFLAAGLWAAFALGVWIAILSGVTGHASRFDPVAWHVHAMLFGFLIAAAAGFLLTAIPNWTGRAPLAGAPLALLITLWVIGRVASLVSTMLPGWLAVAADLAFPLALTAVAGRELLAAGNRRNYPLLLPLGALVVADLLMHLESLGIAVPTGLGGRLGVFCFLVLISVIGGRIVPAFTRNWLSLRGAAAMPPPSGMLDRVALALLHAGLLLWVALPDFAPNGWLLLAASVAQLVRLARWRGPATWREPLLLVLHLGYLWLPIGTCLLGLSLLSDVVSGAAAIHALTAGAFGTMTLAVMTRATLGHSGRALHADGMTVAIYALVILAALLRITAAWGEDWTMPLLQAAAAAWIAAFTLFVAHYGAMLLRPRVG